MIYTVGTNNLIINDLSFQIDSSSGEVILTMPLIAEYVGSGTGNFDKNVTYEFTEIGTNPKGFSFVSDKGGIQMGGGNGSFSVNVKGIYGSPSTYRLTTILSLG